MLLPLIILAVVTQLSTVDVSVRCLNRVIVVFNNQNPSEIEYRIKSRDTLHIRIVGSTVDADVEVDERGMIQIAFVDDDIQAAGRIVNELQTKLRLS